MHDNVLLELENDHKERDNVSISHVNFYPQDIAVYESSLHIVIHLWEVSLTV
jgi:hypothetical protein